MYARPRPGSLITLIQRELSYTPSYGDVGIIGGHTASRLGTYDLSRVQLQYYQQEDVMMQGQQRAAAPASTTAPAAALVHPVRGRNPSPRLCPRVHAALNYLALRTTPSLIPPRSLRHRLQHRGDSPTAVLRSAQSHLPPPGSAHRAPSRAQHGECSCSPPVP